MPYARCPRNAIYTTTSGAQIIKNIKEYKDVTAGKDIQENEDIMKYKDKKEYREMYTGCLHIPVLQEIL